MYFGVRRIFGGFNFLNDEFEFMRVFVCVFVFWVRRGGLKKILGFFFCFL